MPSENFSAFRTVSMPRRILHAAVALALSIVALATGCDARSGSGTLPESAKIAVTSLGEARGVVTREGVVAFLGLPYAQPPLGALRFAPPVALATWGGPIEANSYGPACPQSAIEPGDTVNSRIDEDCLTLNVWTPAAGDGKRAVMFWIHGGGFIAESSGDLLYRGARMAARGDVVVVSVEYRLGAFGFSHFDGEPGSGNAGLLDQLMALRWVQENIAAFGGDPANVTIWGESAGSYSVTSLLGMPGAQGLFHRAIGQSGGSSNVRRVDYAAEATRLLQVQAGVTTLDSMRALTWQQVVTAQESVLAGTPLPESVYGPVIDGVIFSETPLAAMARGLSSDVPLLVGFTKDEGRWWMVDVPLLSASFVTPTGVSLFFPYLERSMPPGESIASASVLYEAEHPEYVTASNLEAIALMQDIILRIPTLRHAEGQLAHQPQNVFVYRFDWAPPNPAYPDLVLGAHHGAELGFTMGQPEGWPEVYGTGGIPTSLRDQIMDAWIAFAKTGNPNHAHLPTWLPYDQTTRPTMLFDAQGRQATSVIAYDPDGVTRAFWDGRAFDGLDPSFLPSDLTTLAP